MVNLTIRLVWNYGSTVRLQGIKFGPCSLSFSKFPFPSGSYKPIKTTNSRGIFSLMNFSIPDHPSTIDGGLSIQIMDNTLYHSFT